MNEAEGALDALVIVVLCQETDLSGLGQLGNLERQLFLRLLNVRAELRFDVVVQLIGLVRAAPDANTLGVVHHSSDGASAQQKSAKY